MRRLAAAWRFAWRELRSGELSLLALALLVAVCATSSVAFFADRVRQGLTLHANQLLAADLAIESDMPLAPSFADSARQAGLQVSGSETFPSMVTTSATVALASLRAVPDNYPLRGEMRVRLGDGRVRQGALRPMRGEVWADSRLLARLGIRLGERVQLGRQSLRLTGELLREPDGALAGYSFMPRLLFNQTDLAATGLTGPGARIRWRLMVSGPVGAVEAWRRSAEAHLPAGARIESIDAARPELRSAMARARRVLGLTAMLTATLAAAAMILAVRRYLARHWQPAAVLRCLGLSGREITGLFATALLAVALVAGVAGSLLGYLLQAALAGIAIPDAGTTLPPPAGWLFWLGPATALLLSIGLGLPPVMALRRVPPSAVLRAEAPPRSMGMAVPPLAILTLIALSLWQVDDGRLASWLLAGMSGYFLVAGLAGWCLVRATRLLARGDGAIGWRFGVAALARRPWLTALQVVALSMGLMALLTLTVVRVDLLDAWHQSLPADAPNQFVINLQPEQLRDFDAAFVAARLPLPETAPMVRGRLLAINGRPVRVAQFRDEQAERLAGREFNLSWRDTPPTGNSVVAGHWWPAAAADEFSLEEALAQTLGIRLGDRLTFDVAGTPLNGRVTSLRAVAWNSFRINFFVLVPRATLSGRTASLVAAFHLPAAQRGFADGLVRRFPNLTAIDVSDVLDQLREVIDRLAQAVEALFVLTLCAGVLVLWAALGATRDERLADAALMRALGASRRQLRAVALAELLWLGAFTGLLAGSGAMLLGALAGWKLLELPLRFNGSLPPLGLLCGMLLVPLAGWPLLRRVVRQTPLSTLQAR